MTLLTIAQDILRETKSAIIPTTIIGNNQEAAKQVLVALKKAIVDVSRANWQILQKEHSFNTVASTEAYSLPTDFDSITDSTFWNVTTQKMLIGSVTARDWRLLKNSSVSGASVNDYYRIRGNEMLIFPTPSGTESMIYEYRTNEIVEDSLGNGQTGWEADDDVPVVDAYLVQLNATWRILQMQGRLYAEEQKDYELALAERLSVDGGSGTVFHNNINYFNRSRIGYPDTIVP